MVDDQLIELRPALAVIWRRKAIVIAVVVASVGVAWAYSATRREVYVAESQFLPPREVASTLSGVRNSTSRDTRPEGELSVETQARIVASPVVANRVSDALGRKRDPEKLARAVSVVPIGDELLVVRAEAGRPEEAATLANAFAEQFLAYRREQAVAQVASASDELEKQRAELETALQGFNDRIATLTGEIAALLPSTRSGPNDPPFQPALASLRATKEAEVQRLTTERNQLLVRSSELSDRAQELRNAQQLASGGGEVVKPATAPSQPVSPRPARDLAAGILLGLILGMAAAFATEHLDVRVRTREDASLAAGAPVLVNVPRLTKTGRDRPELVAAGGSKAGGAAESFRALRATLVNQGLGTSVRSVLVTSSEAGEGKTVTAANLASACASAGLSTLVVGGDQPRSRLHDLFGLARRPGVLEVLRGTSSLSAAVRTSPHPNLWVLPSGDAAAGNRDLFGSLLLPQALAEIGAAYEVVVVDGPALADGADAIALAGAVGASVLVVRAGQSDARRVRAASLALARANSRLLGVVLTMADPDDDTLDLSEMSMPLPAPGSGLSTVPAVLPADAVEHAAPLGEQPGRPPRRIAGQATRRALAGLRAPEPPESK